MRAQGISRPQRLAKRRSRARARIVIPLALVAGALFYWIFDCNFRSPVLVGAWTQSFGDNGFNREIR